MSPPSPRSELPSALDIVRGVALAPMAIVISTTALPGFLFCVPAIIFALALVAIPLVAILVLALAATVVVAVPVLLVWAVRRVSRRRRARDDEPVTVAAPAPAPEWAGRDAVPSLAGFRTPSVRRP
jgi:hypothetical protein